MVLACSIIFAIVYVADMVAHYTGSFLKIETFLGLETVATARFTWNIFLQSDRLPDYPDHRGEVL